MSVKIRLQRHGAKKAPFYRLVVADSRVKRDGRFVELIGTYNPKSKRAEEELRVKLDRAEYWLGVGAQPSDTVRSLINRARRLAPLGEEAAAPVASEQENETPPAPAPAAAVETTAAAAAPENTAAPVAEDAAPPAEEASAADEDVLTSAMDMGDEEPLDEPSEEEPTTDSEREKA